jgi:hypothetical protein
MIMDIYKMMKAQLEWLRDCTDSEMRDGDAAREIAASLLEAYVQCEAQVPVAWAAQNTRTGKFHYIWHKQDDVDGWITREHQSQDEMTFRKVTLYTSPPPAQVPSEWVEALKGCVNGLDDVMLELGFDALRPEFFRACEVLRVARALLAKQEGS